MRSTSKQLLAVFLVACGSASHGGNGGGTGGSSGAGGAGGKGGGSSSPTGGSTSMSGGTVGTGGSGGSDAEAGSNSVPGSAGVSDSAGAPPTVGSTGDVKTALPSLAQTLSNVVATESDDSVVVSFDAFDGAADYRVYPLPSDDDISVDSDGNVNVKNAIYRCAGHRESAAPYIDDPNANNQGWLETVVDSTAHGQQVGGFSRTPADATLGYVSTVPGDGLVPVYVLGESNLSADNTCGFSQWAASRVKKYTTSDSERTSLLASGARDDGIAFYVPSNGDSSTTQIYTSDDGMSARYYFPAGAEADVHQTKTAAFSVFSKAQQGTAPLKRVFYVNYCGWAHDELAVGEAAFQRIYQQGSNLPLQQVLWSGITGPQTLVVEALDNVCPFQGHLAPDSIAEVVTGDSPPLYHQPWFSIDDVLKADGEVYVNGQAGPQWIWRSDQPHVGSAPGDAPPRPKAIARSFIKVAPAPHQTMDFFADFSSADTASFAPAPCLSPDNDCGGKWRYLSSDFDATFLAVESQKSGDGLLSMGPIMGEFWVSYADIAADTNGKFRLTALQKATMSDNSYLHVRMEVNGYSTARRYPQIMISDRDAPIQYSLDQGHTIIAQPKGDSTPWAAWPVRYDLEVCNLRTWDVNNQCPIYDLWEVKDSSGKATLLGAGDALGDHLYADLRTLFEIYASTKRAYLFLDGKPYACADMPAGGAPSGPVTVTWGDVLYHSSVDQTFQGEADPFTTTQPTFHSEHMQIETRREFDNLGFSSNVAAPAWDETRFPCAAASSIHDF
ncbi:MAG TPA: hypothetical protein VMI54_10780 [Polyangiaceae bacterium]|nr:hypothetical protein [Polyangiaceae bacterium]